MGTKIQINSLEALERLIGNDNDIEIEIRSSIVVEFTKKHLKQIADDAMVRSISEGLKKEVENYFGKWISGKGWGQQDFKFHGEVADKINKFVGDFVWNYVNEATKKAIDTHANTDRVNKLIEERSNYIVQQWTSTEIERRIQQAADRKIKEKLGIN